MNQLKLNIFKGTLLVIFTSGFLITQPAFSDYNSEYHSYLKLEIEMEKSAFKSNEPIEGKVIMTNSAPATIPGSFTVNLYKEDKSTFTTTIYIKTIYPGRTDFEFKHFGIPKIGGTTDSIGHWRLVIYPSNKDEPSGIQKEFEIVE